jgi:ABC-type Fe3+-hydroxamate transport system substrate-binding protein
MTMAANPPAEATRRVLGSLVGDRVALPTRPLQVVSLVSGLTEAIWAMGLSERAAAVSHYCSRYVNIGARPVAGRYLQIDDAILAAVHPDLVLTTGGVQLGVARKLAAADWPVYVLPLPESFHGILENIRRLGALLGEMEAAFALTTRMEGEAAQLRALPPARRPRVLAEFCCGRHMRMVGGLTFVHDLIALAGSNNVLGAETEGYMKLDVSAAPALRLEIVLVFWEKDDHAVDVPGLLRERGWPGKWPFRLIEAGIQRKRNLIHDGRSLLETARWLAARMAKDPIFT